MPTTLTGLKSPAIAISNTTGITLIAGFDGTNWVCYKRNTPSDSFALVGTITSGSANTYAGLEFANSPDGRVVFVLQSGSNTVIYNSFDLGANWTAV